MRVAWLFHPFALLSAGLFWLALDAALPQGRAWAQQTSPRIALVVVTEWQEFRSPDFGAIRGALKQPLVFDGRNLYSPDAMRAWNDRSRENLGVDTLDLVQLHCPPTDLYATDAVFDDLGRNNSLAAVVGDQAFAAKSFHEPLLHGIFGRAPVAGVLQGIHRGQAVRVAGRGRHRAPVQPDRRLCELCGPGRLRADPAPREVAAGIKIPR